ncbi:MAG: hypothetical protein ACOYIK_01135 [Coriobacteriales bacterium]
MEVLESQSIGCFKAATVSYLQQHHAYEASIGVTIMPADRVLHSCNRIAGKPPRWKTLEVYL